jgi:hypothetical protein
MTKTYLVVLNTEFDRDAIITYLDGLPEIESWQISLPFSFFIKTELTAMGVFGLIIKEFPSKSDNEGIYIVQVSNDSFGLLPEGHWKWLGKHEAKFDLGLLTRFGPFKKK